MAKRKAAVAAVLQAVEVNGTTYMVPATLEELACAITRQGELIASHEGSAFEHSVVEGQFLIEARRRVKTEKKKGDAGWMKWLETNYQFKRESAYRSISIAENFDLVRECTSRMEALAIIQESKKAAIEAGTATAHGNRGRVRQIAAPVEDVVVPPAASTNGNGHGSDYDDRAEHRAALAAEVSAIQTLATADTPVHVVTVGPAPTDDDEDGPSEDELSSDPEIAEILAEFTEEEETPAPVVVVVVPTETEPIPGFQFAGSPQQVALQQFQATLDRFEVELGPVTLYGSPDAELKSLTVLLTDVQIRLDSLLDRVNKVVEDRKIRNDLKAARQGGLIAS